MPKLRRYENDQDVKPRLRARTRGGPVARFYADFRDFKDVGGDWECLVPSGENRATTEPQEAERLANTRLAELQARRKLRPTGAAARRTLGLYAKHHLEQKAVMEEADEQWIASAQRHLEEARDFFGDGRDLADIQVSDVNEYAAHLLGRSNGRGSTLSGASSVHYLNSLSNLFRRAISEQILSMGHNPVAAMVSKPKIRRRKTPWLEIQEVAKILAFAKDYVPIREDLALPSLFEILAGMALTGCREAELLGLQVDEVDLDRRIITVQPNTWRRLKTENSERPVPIHSQLAEIWGAYLSGPARPMGRLMFPGFTDEGEERMIVDLRRAYDKMPMPERLRRARTPREIEKAEAKRLALLARWDGKKRGPKPKIPREELLKPVPTTIVPPLRSKIFRHSYCAARLQTLDNGKPISVYSVAVEMGHEDIKMVKKVYGHLGRFRYRGEEVEYRLPSE